MLDQCTPEDLNSILQKLEVNSSPQETAQVLASLQSQSVPMTQPMQSVQPFAAYPMAVVPPMAPVPPAAPSPGRRPRPGNMQPVSASPGALAGESVTITMEQLQGILAEHSMGVLSEVQRMLPLGATAASTLAGVVQGVDGVDISPLAQAVLERDCEVRELEERLASLQLELQGKDQRIAALSNELDSTVREVRHRQLDLEFHQLKLEERVRSNAELEQLQNRLTTQVEEVSLSARHAALDMQMSPMTPRSLCAQGSLSWTLRSKGRSPLNGAIEGLPLQH